MVVELVECDGLDILADGEYTLNASNGTKRTHHHLGHQILNGIVVQTTPTKDGSGAIQARGYQTIPLRFRLYVVFRIVETHPHPLLMNVPNRAGATRHFALLPAPIRTITLLRSPDRPLRLCRVP